MITVNYKIKEIVEKMINLHIYKGLPRGVSELYDIKALSPKSTLNVIFDVGANVGQL